VLLSINFVTPALTYLLTARRLPTKALWTLCSVECFTFMFIYGVCWRLVFIKKYI